MGLADALSESCDENRSPRAGFVQLREEFVAPFADEGHRSWKDAAPDGAYEHKPFPPCLEKNGGGEETKYIDS
jgi:hypothetical protein